MWRALDRKLLRDLRRLRGQVITIALVLASGITSYIALRGTYESLEGARAAYYDTHRFGHAFAALERAPESLRGELEALPAIAMVDTRLTAELTLPIEGMKWPAYGRVLSIPADRAPLTNTLYLRSGRLPARGRADEVALLESFADAHGLEPGHHLRAVVHGELRSLRVVGIVLSPEFVFAIRPGALAEDAKRYAVLWMERSALARILRLEGTFNDVSVLTQRGASEAEVRLELDEALKPYGGKGAILRKDQLSNRVLSQELRQLESLAKMVPLVFLAVSAFLVNLVLGRLIRLQRPEIATLKSIGYSNRDVGAHYLCLVLVVLLPGSLLGVLGGVWLGRVVIGLYSRAFRFPELSFDLNAALVAAALAASGAAAFLGALGAVRTAVRLPPAEAMRPPAPAKYRRGLVERIGVLASPSMLMVLREVTRRPLRTLLSSLGIAGAVALLILGRFGWDSLTRYFDETFLREQRQDLTVTFDRPMSPRVVGQLARTPGVLSAEPLRAISVRIRHEHRTRDVALIGLSPQTQLRRLVDGSGEEVTVPDEGVVLTATLGAVLGLGLGDPVSLELNEGDRRTVRVTVAAFVDEAVGLQVYASDTVVGRLSGDLGAVSAVLLRVDPRSAGPVERRLRDSPHVLDVGDVRADMARLFEMNASVMNVWTLVSITLASSVIFGVVYNNARIALAARGRELASLRVLGFSRREISSILLGSLAVDVAVALPAGLVLGTLWAHQFMSTVAEETFRWRVYVAPQTYLLAIAVTLLAATASGFLVRRRLDELDLIEVLKARE